MLSRDTIKRVLEGTQVQAVFRIRCNLDGATSGTLDGLQASIEARRLNRDDVIRRRDDLECQIERFEGSGSHDDFVG